MNAAPRRGPAGGAPLSAEAFNRIVQLASRHAGLTIRDRKFSLVQSRVSRRLVALGVGDFTTYLDFVETPKGRAERAALIECLTTNTSRFFREDHHFDLLRYRILPPLIERARSGGRVRIWSAGVSGGQELYSAAMVLLDLFPGAGATDIRLLGTDIDRRMIEVARLGRYAPDVALQVPEELRQRFLPQTADGTHRITDDLRRICTFRGLNLQDPWPFAGQFDVVFCRNVVIYFDAKTQQRLWPRFARTLSADGWLCLGHSERIDGPAAASFESVSITTYRPATTTSVSARARVRNRPTEPGIEDAPPKRAETATDEVPIRPSRPVMAWRRPAADPDA